LRGKPDPAIIRLARAMARRHAREDHEAAEREAIERAKEGKRQ